MKLGSPRQGTSFYEAFSDLIFGTMAIFVLLMLVFLIQVSAARESESQEESTAELKEKIEELQKEVEHAKEETSEAKEKQQSAENAATDLKPKPVDLVIAVDGTSSMGATLGSIQRNIESAAEIASRISPRFRLGLVVYRDQNNSYRFPLTDIKPTLKGIESDGIKQLKQFLHEKHMEVWRVEGSNGETGGQIVGDSYLVTRLEPLKALANIEYGVKESFSLLAPDGNKDTRKVLILAGDVGPWEMHNESRADDPSDIESRDRILEMAKSFITESSQNRILSIYTGPTAPFGNHPHQRESISFFKSFADVAGIANGRYSDDATQIAATVVEAVVGVDDK